MRTEKWLTTLDNPFDYWAQHEAWKRYDEDKGYYTSELVARFARYSRSMDPDEENEAINAACEEIFKWNPTGNYRVIERSIPKDYYDKLEEEENENEIKS